MRRQLARLHAWAGLVVGLYVLLMASTGMLLSFRDELLGWMLGIVGPPRGDALAGAARLAERLEPGSFTTIEMPTDALSAYTVYMPHGRTILFDQATLDPVADPLGAQRFTDFVFDLHHHLAMGETGETIAGVLGLAMAVLILVGLYLWWPWRRGVSPRHAVAPARGHSGRLARHIAAALIAMPAALLLAFTGAGMIFPTLADALFAPLGQTGDAKAVPTAPVSTISDAARAQFPQAVPRMLSPSEGGYKVRLRAPLEAHPSGRTRFAWDSATGAVSDPVYAPALSTAERASNFLYPLHTGAAGGLTLRIVFLLSGALLFVAIWSSLASYIARLGRARKRRRRRGTAVAVGT